MSKLTKNKSKKVAKMISTNKRNEVKRYFVLARIIKKDGSLSAEFKSFDFANKARAQAKLHRLNKEGSFETLPYQLIEHTAQECDLTTLCVAPQCVRETYNKNAGLL